MKTFWVNYFGEDTQIEIIDALDSGEAVRVGADCIGHTRAAMIEAQAKEFFEEIGAKVTCKDEFGNEYYTRREEND